MSETNVFCEYETCKNIAERVHLEITPSSGVMQFLVEGKSYNPPIQYNLSTVSELYAFVKAFEECYARFNREHGRSIGMTFKGDS